MTDEIMSLRTLLEKSADADLLREMVGLHDSEQVVNSPVQLAAPGQKVRSFSEN